MSWAAKRTTSRREDIAYCLMGLFGVHMPLLYGEGDRAFLRLQEEILKTSDDHSLFAWTKSLFYWVHENLYCGLLAQHPSDFDQHASWYGQSHNTIRAPAPAQIYEDQSTTVTNKGIRFVAPLVPLAKVVVLGRLSTIRC